MAGGARPYGVAAAAAALGMTKSAVASARCAPVLAQVMAPCKNRFRPSVFSSLQVMTTVVPTKTGFR